MSPISPLADRLAVYAHSLSYNDLDEVTIECVKTLVVDTIGCGLGALDAVPVRICREVSEGAGDAATILGTTRRTSAELAAFANAAACRYLDFNDTYTAKFAVHPSDSIAALIAVAEAERASARDLILAIVIAYEINCRLVDALDISTRGWDPPIFGLPAVALGAGKLMGLDATQLSHALALALNDHIPMAQTRVGALSLWKGVAVAEAGRNSIFAARLARAGMTGPAPIFEGRSGLFAQVTGPAEIDVAAFGGRGREFRVHRCSLKPYPAVIYTQTAIVAGIEVAAAVGDLPRIERIEIATTKRGLQRTGSEPEKWDPQTRETADHSLPYITARAMFDGNITRASFAPEKFRDPAVLAFMRNITVAEDPALTSRVGSGAVPTRVTAILQDGSRISREVDHAPGFANRPMPRADVERKFRGNLGPSWPADHVANMLESLWSLDQRNDLRALMHKLAKENGDTHNFGL